MITVQRIRSASEVSLPDISNLLSQLRPGVESVATDADLRTITEDKNVMFIAAKDDTKAVGMATAYLAVKFGKKMAFVEDVVVDDTYRGKGLGRKIMEELAKECKEAGVSQINLTSRPDRVAANELYKKLGFQPKETNVYRLKL